MKENQLPIFFRYRILWHIFFWVLIYLMYVITFGGYMDRYYEEILNNLALMPARIIGTYILIYGILPLALHKKKFLLFIILTIVHSFVFAFAIWLTLRLGNFFPEIHDFSRLPVFSLGKIFSTLLSNYGILMLAVTIVIFKKWYVDEMQKKKLVEEKLEAELSFLKSQIHPHFLFNTLNNLYALTLIKSEQTSDVVLKLSGLLDYMIYKSNDKFVALSQELEILENYIDLEKLRYNERLNFDCQIEGEPGFHKIAPLILLPFIENSFKHGASVDRANPKIRIKIKIGSDCVKLNVVNSLRGEKEKDESLSVGIGLKNVRRRLELIYPEMHKLDIRQSEQEFEVNLEVCWINE